MNNVAQESFDGFDKLTASKLRTGPACKFLSRIL